MTINFHDYKLIDNQYFGNGNCAMTEEQKRLFYCNERLALRETDIPRAVDEVVKGLSSQPPQPMAINKTAENVRTLCFNAFSKALVRHCQSDLEEMVVSLRVAVRVEALVKRVIGGESGEVVLKPYKVGIGSSRFNEYVDIESYRRTETAFSDTLAVLFTERADEVFDRRKELFFEFLELLYPLAAKTQEDICRLAMSIIKKKNVSWMIKDLVKQFSKHPLRSVLLETKENSSWLYESNLFPTLKSLLPELTWRLDELEEEILLRKRNMQQLVVDIKDNELLQFARSLWKSDQSVARKAQVEPASNQKELPPECLCPITGEKMENPVVTEAGIVYENDAIVLWLKGNNTDPVTRKQISKNLIPVYALKSLIERLSGIALG